MRQGQSGNAVVIFTPPVKPSISNEASFHLFLSTREASVFVNELFQPLQEVSVYAMLPKHSFIGSHEAMLPVYEGNIRLLERTMKLNDINSDVQSYHRNIANMERSFAAEQNKTQDAIHAEKIIQREIMEVQGRIDEVQKRTNILLYEQLWPEWESAESIPTNGSRNKPNVKSFVCYHQFSDH